MIKAVAQTPASRASNGGVLGIVSEVCVAAPTLAGDRASRNNGSPLTNIPAARPEFQEVMLKQSDRPLKNDEAGGAEKGMSGPQHQHDTPGEDCSVLTTFHDFRDCGNALEKIHPDPRHWSRWAEREEPCLF